MKKRLLSWLLVLTMVISLIPSTLVTTAFAANAAGGGVNITGEQTLTLNADSDTAITADGTYTVSGSSTHSILIGADTATDTPATKVNVTLVLNGLKINSATSPIQILGGSELTLVLADGTENVLNCTKTGNAGEFDTSAGAGILCELGAKLTIDKAQGAAGTGSLTVTGGYGGAGIGGGRFDSLYTGDRAATGGSSTRNYNLGNQVNWQGGAGGIGGRHGANAGTAGSVTINAGVLNITGGNGAAGIGGGMGAAGEAGTKGNNANSAVRFDGGGAAGSWFGTGGGGGGAGGNGGRGGSGGDVTINGGAVTVTGGRFTLNRNGKTVDVIPASIGGGAGGIGGNGGDGGSPANSSVNQPGGRWGTKGGIGETGYMNYNGDGGNLIVNGGTLSAVGNIRVGDDANRKGIQCAWADRNQGYARGDTHCGYAAGIGAEATAPTLDSEQKALNIQVKGSENNVRFLDYDNTTKLSAQPTDKNSKTLYEVTLTVRNKADDTVVSSANVEVAVNKTDAAAKYTYKTVSDLDGKATLWLPKGEYSLSYFDVNRSDVGIIQQGDGKTFTVEENNNNAEEVKIGLNVTASASLPNTDKVYINDTTAEANAPLSIKIDASGASNSSLGNIKWFREKVNDNTKTYALYQTVNEYAFDASGYDNVTKQEDKGELTVAAGTKEAELKVLENGRYWLKIPMTVTDPNDPSKSMTVNLIRLVEVKNIYREYSIQVKSVELDQKGNPKGNPDYAPLKTALGTNYAGSYGFAWDLNGYQSQTLLKNPSAGFDTVQINGLNSKVKWYNATFGTPNTPMNKNAAKTGFEPVTLTLNQDFLTANRNADKGAGGQPDPTKYTITYTPEGVPVAEVTIRGIVLNDEGTELKELWSYDNSYPEGVTEATINGFKQDGYRIDKVLINGTERAGVTLTGNSIHLTDLQGTQANNYTDAIEKVEFVYVNNMVDVTVKAMYNGKELQSTTISLEKGVQMTVSAPSIEGYTADEASQTYTPVDGANTITFQYTKDAGNVTVVAVDQNGNTEIYRKDGGTVNRGDKIDLTGDAKAPTIEYYTTPSAPKSVTVNGVAVPNLDAYTYNGVGDIVVTYEYTRKTRDITIVKKDVATGGKIEEQTLQNLSVGESHTFIAGEVTVPANYEAAADRNPTTYFVEDKADQTVTFWYKNTSDSQYAQVTVNLTCDSEIFQTYPVTAVKGVLTTIKAPDVRGYNIDGDAAKSITPTGINDVVEFTYTISNPKTVKVELKTNSDATNPDAELNAPAGYTKSYTLKDGDSITIWAPTLEGYALRGATLNGTGQTDMQPVTVDYANLPSGTSTVVFRYLPVAQANFVTHTIKFMLGTQELYSYEKMVVKGTGKQVSYPKDAVADMVPGYIYSNTTYEVGGKTVGADKVLDNTNAVIIYHFKEDTAQITIKFQDANGDPLKSGGVAEPDKVLTGYRKGQTIEVPAPVLNGFALAPNEDLIKTVALSATDANTEVAFKYVPLAKTYFILKEKLADGTEKIITFINAKENTKYDPNETGNPLDLSDFGYSFTTDADKVGTDVSNEFAAGGAGSVTTGAILDSKTYTLYYVKGVRSVEFVPVNKDKLDAAQKTLNEVIQDGTVDTYKIDGLTPAAMEDARIGETYKASAQSFNGWALKDDFTKLYKVETGNGPLKVYFLYAAKSLGDVTVHYHFGDSHNAGKLLNEYTIKAVVGEKVSITAPEYLLDNKYHLKNGQTNPVVREVTAAKNEVEFYYEANFVNVTTKVVLDGGAANTHETYEVIKNTGSQTLYPPEKAGYTLVGITAEGATLTGGTADKLPPEYTNNRLTLTGLTADATVTYYYKTTKASEYQTTLTVEYKYNGYDLAALKTVNANTGDDNSIDVPAFDGYKATTYTFKDGAGADTTSGINGTSVTVNPKEKTATLTITYVRPDNTIVLPGKDDKIPSPDDKDNIIVKPGDKTPTIDGDGKVTIPDDSNGTVIRPDPVNPDKKEEITVPGGTTIDKDGTIKLPEPQPNGTVITPDTKLPDGLPADSDYVVITYNANNSTGEIKKELGKKNELTVKANPFTGVSGATFVEWNDNGNGNGKTYAVTDTVNTSVVLYAQWKSSYKYSATITYKPNGGTPDTDSVQIVGSDADSNLIATIAKNSFSVSGWDFGGWNETANGSGKLYLPGAKLPMQNSATQDLYAQWYKQTGSSITVPGKDGDPNNEQTNVTGKGEGISRDPDTGVITIPNGGTITVTKPDGKKETILLPNGGTLNPDGSYTIKQPDGGKIDVDNNGNEKPKDDQGNVKPNVEIVTMTYHSNNGEDGVVNVKAIKGEDTALIANPFKWSGYKFLNWMGTDKKEYQPGDTVKAAEGEFFAQWYKKDDSTTGSGSIELPGKDGAIEAPNDKDNVIVTPGENGTLDGPKKPDGSVEVKDDEGTVTRPDPNDPNYPNGSKEDIKVPAGSVIYPDGTIKLPDGTIIKPDQKYPDEVIPKDYVIVTYEPNGGTGNVVRQMVKTNEVTAILDGSLFTAPRGKTFDKWLDEDNNKSYAAGDELTTGKDVTLKAQWKTSNPTPTTYSAEIKFDPNTDEAAATQTLTGTTGEILSGKLDAYADHFTAPADWTFMGWSTARAASQNATFYEDEASITLRDKDTLPLYAIVYKVDADTKVVTLPGADGKADSSDDVTVTPANGSTITPGKGYVEAPAGSTITLPGNKTITVIEGTVKVYPDGSVYVPDGSKVKLPDDKVVDGGNGGTTVKPDGTEDTDKTKPIQKPDGTIILPGEDGKTGTGDDIIVKPNGDKPAGRIDADGNVTITAPDGADVTIPGNDPADVKVPNGTVITPNGDITLVYTIKYVDKNGKELKTAATKRLKVGEIETVKAVTIDGYKVSGDETHTINAAVSADLKDYVITFTYEKKAAGGNTGGGGSSGGGSSSGGSSSGGSSSGSGTTKPSQPDTKPTPGTKPNDPTQTGIANWLRTDKHTTSMTGYGNGKFGPEDSVTRAQVAQIFYRLLKDQNVTITASFSDVADDAWYAKAVNTLASLGIIKGTSEGKFDPNRAISRAEFCAIATRFAKVASTVKNPFADINEQDWYYTAVTTAASYDWVNGMSDGNFHPHDVISRAQAATIINRMLGAAADRSYVDSHVTNPYTDVSTTHWAYYQIIEASIAHDHDYDKEGVEIWTGLK